MKFDGVLKDKECQQLIESAAPRLRESRLVNKVVSEIRTSRGMFFEERESPLIQRIERRISQLMNVPIEHAEGLQVLHYGPGQEYKVHYDFFGQNSPAARNNRISTLVIYLNDVEEGGETVFPLLDLAVKPKRGSAVYFEYFYRDLQQANLAQQRSCCARREMGRHPMDANCWRWLARLVRTRTA